MLLLVSGLVIISGIIQMNNTKRTELLPARTVDKYYEQQARNISGSLIDKAINNLLIDMEWEGTVTTNDNYSGEGTLTTSADPDNPLDEYKVLLTSSASYGGYTAETQVLMSRDSFSKYSYFTDAEKLPDGQEIWWWDGDEVTGPMHTNGTFRMSGSPTFNGFVSSPNDWVGYTGNEDSNNPDVRHGSDTPQFNEGANFNLNRTRDLPSEEQLTELANLASTGGITFAEDAELEFYIDSNEGFVKRIKDSTETSYQLSDYNSIISVTGQAKVKGIVKGQVTLHSTQKIEIMGDILYDTSPIDDVNSTDLLGLVSEGNVIIDKDAHTDNGSSNLTIHASIMALNTSFEVEDWSSGDPRGTLNLLGGIIQKNRGPVGTFSGGSVKSGFTKSYVYDDRLLQTIPPSFPRESIFSIVYWKDNPVVKSDN
ncbi:MAG: DUF4900 domain-containing protein [Balneolaceae bacterium]